MMLYRLLSSLDSHKFDSQVISLTDKGSLGKKIEDLGIPVRTLNAKRRIPDPRVLIRLYVWLRKSKPDIVHSWMYHANLIGGIATKIYGKAHLIWAIHHSQLDFKNDKRTTLWTAKAGAMLSGWLPSTIVCCSQATKKTHAKLGYKNNKMMVIPNGFDLALFAPNLGARKAIREELGLGEETIIIGLVARFHPHKDLFSFCQAAGHLHRIRPDVHFLLCGEGINWSNSQLAGWVDKAGIRPVTHLLGIRTDIPIIQASMDIATLSSSSEGFPNAIGEAMASGVPCVATDVGDISIIIGDTGLVIGPGNPDILSNAWKEMIDMGPEERRRLGEKARQRIKTYFSLDNVVNEYCCLYRTTLTKEAKSSPHK